MSNEQSGDTPVMNIPRVDWATHVATNTAEHKALTVQAGTQTETLATIATGLNSLVSIGEHQIQLAERKWNWWGKHWKWVLPAIGAGIGALGTAAGYYVPGYTAGVFGPPAPSNGVVVEAAAEPTPAPVAVKAPTKEPEPAAEGTP
ncbi:MAG: hypothetical protein GY788_21140 [bacterium]|nr:hypothetical protein [bacterium]